MCFVQSLVAPQWLGFKATHGHHVPAWRVDLQSCMCAAANHKQTAPSLSGLLLQCVVASAAAANHLWRLLAAACHAGAGSCTVTRLLLWGTLACRVRWDMIITPQSTALGCHCPAGQGIRLFGVSHSGGGIQRNGLRWHGAGWVLPQGGKLPSGVAVHEVTPVEEVPHAMALWAMLLGLGSRWQTFPRTKCLSGARCGLDEQAMITSCMRLYLCVSCQTFVAHLPSSRCVLASLQSSWRLALLSSSMSMLSGNGG